MLLADPAHSPSILPADLPCAYAMNKSVEKLHKNGQKNADIALGDHNTVTKCDNEIAHRLVDIDIEARAKLHGDIASHVDKDGNFPGEFHQNAFQSRNG